MVFRGFYAVLGVEISRDELLDLFFKHSDQIVKDFCMDSALEKWTFDLNQKLKDLVGEDKAVVKAHLSRVFYEYSPEIISGFNEPEESHFHIRPCCTSFQTYVVGLRADFEANKLTSKTSSFSYEELPHMINDNCSSMQKIIEKVNAMDNAELTKILEYYGLSQLVPEVHLFLDDCTSCS